MSEVRTETLAGQPDDTPQRAPRAKVVVHRLDGGLEEGESDARTISAAGFPIYSGSDSQRPRLVPTRDIKYVVFGSVDDPALEADPGDKTSARRAILRFRDGEWIAAYIDQGVQPEGDGLALKIRLAELQRVIPAVAASPSLLEMQFVDTWMLSRSGDGVAAVIAPTAAANSGILAFAIISLGMGVLWVVNTLVSQAYGRRDYAACGQFLWQGVWFALVFALLPLPTLPFAPRAFA